MNINYKRSRSKEYQLKNSLEKEGYFTVRTAGSHGIADVIAIKPSPDGNPNLFVVRFIQIKVSERTKTKKIIYKVEDSPCGLINVEYHKFPVLSKKYYARFRRK